MEKVQSLQQTNDLIKECSDRIDGLRRHIRGLEEHIALHVHIEKQLKQNLSVLKDHETVAIASEYKRAKEDMGVIGRKITISQIDLKNSVLSLEKAEKLVIELKAKHDMILESQKGKVLTGHFGHK